MQKNRIPWSDGISPSAFFVLNILKAFLYKENFAKVSIGPLAFTSSVLFKKSQIVQKTKIIPIKAKKTLKNSSNFVCKVYKHDDILPFHIDVNSHCQYFSNGIIFRFYSCTPSRSNIQFQTGIDVLR